MSRAGEPSGESLLMIDFDLDEAGFGLCIQCTMNLALYAERQGLTPVAAYDDTSGGAFVDAGLGSDMWSQYFEPLAGCTSADVRDRIVDPGDPLVASDLVRLSHDEATRIIMWHPDSVFAWTYGQWRKRPPRDLEAWYTEQRFRGRYAVARYVRPKSHILAVVDEFWSSRIDAPFVLGVHIRGTDHHYAPPVAPAEYFGSIDGWLRDQPELQIFLATDQIQFLELFRDRYGERVVSYDCLRSENEIAPFQMEGSPYRKGEDVLIDMLLLARCDHLIRGASHVPEVAMYFGSDLQCTDLSLRKSKAYGQDYGAGWSYEATLPAWRLFSGSDLSRVRSDSESQGPLQALSYQARHLAALVRRVVERVIGALGS